MSTRKDIRSLLLNLAGLWAGLFVVFLVLNTNMIHAVNPVRDSAIAATRGFAWICALIAAIAGYAHLLVWWGRRKARRAPEGDER